MASVVTAPRVHSGSLAQVLRRGQVRSLYQPIVELDTGLPVAYEALARGPQGSPMESPFALFGAAHEQGLVAELDRACRDAAVEGALAAGLAPPLALFVNVEPAAVLSDDAPLSHEADLLAGRLRVVANSPSVPSPTARPRSSPPSRGCASAVAGSRSRTSASTSARSRSCPSSRPT
jgi:hypothetical protein